MTIEKTLASTSWESELYMDQPHFNYDKNHKPRLPRSLQVSNQSCLHPLLNARDSITHKNLCQALGTKVPPLLENLHGEKQV